MKLHQPDQHHQQRKHRREHGAADGTSESFMTTSGSPTQDRPVLHQRRPCVRHLCARRPAGPRLFRTGPRPDRPDTDSALRPPGAAESRAGRPGAATPAIAGADAGTSAVAAEDRTSGRMPPLKLPARAGGRRARRSNGSTLHAPALEVRTRTGGHLSGSAAGRRSQPCHLLRSRR